MRSLIVALVLAVSPLGPAVCEVHCAVNDAAPEPGQPRTSDHDKAARIVFIRSADDDHDCAHPDSTPAILGSGRGAAPDRLAASLPADCVVSAPSLITRFDVLSTSSSPPNPPPRIAPLRI